MIFRNFKFFVCSLILLQCSWLAAQNKGLAKKTDKRKLTRENTSIFLSDYVQSQNIDLLDKTALLILSDFDPKNGTVLIRWLDIAKDDVEYNVYRSNKPILKIKDLDKANLRGTVEAGKMQYVDFLEQPGKYYYAVLTKIDGKVEFSLVKEHSSLEESVQFAAFEKNKTILT